MRKICFAVLTLGYRELSESVGCAYAQTGCHTHSLADLFERVIQPSSRMHVLSRDLHSEFREQLTEVIVRLLRAWVDPLSQLYGSMSQDQNQDANHYSSNTAPEISDMVNEMTPLGVICNTMRYISPESLVPSSAFPFYKQGELKAMGHQDLLYCFLRDANKVKNYIRILKCTILPELDC